MRPGIRRRHLSTASFNSIEEVKPFEIGGTLTKTIPSEALYITYIERVTTIPKGSTCKCMEAEGMCSGT
nr:MAG TPA: hypothetical protein [Caudoviricetes sp.]